MLRAELRQRLSRYAAAGSLATVGGVASLRVEEGRLRGAARSHGGGFFHVNTDNILLRSFRSGADYGLLLAICAGNYKDEGCCLAAATAASTFFEAFHAPLISDADIAPTLRRALLAANDGIVKISQEPIADLQLQTVLGKRTTLSGIGTALTAVAALPDRLWVAHIGDSKAYLVRDGRPRKLTVEHTLSHVAEYRERIKCTPNEAIAHADQIVLRMLGTSENAPDFDVSRVELLPRDRILLGTEALTSDLATTVTLQEIPEIETACEVLGLALSETHLPVTFGIIDIREPGCPSL